MADYNTYTNYVCEILEKNDIRFFKSNPNYTYMLEHVNHEQGLQYLECIKTKTQISDSLIRVICGMNDTIGSPNKQQYDDNLHVSPTSLRYIWQAHLILSHFYEKSKDDPIDIVEIGGGYGGLCLVIHALAKYYNISIKSYTIIDLDAPSKLQRKYLSAFSWISNVYFVNAETYGQHITNTNLYVISNYCFSEIDHIHQTQYIQHLFPKVSHGFFAWNNIPVYNFGFEMIDLNEVPNTGGKYNRFIFF